VKRLADNFLLLAVAFALLGMGFGLYIAASNDHTLAGAHAHNNLLGWVTMAIYGLYYRLVPTAVTRLATVHFAVTVIGNLIFPVGIGLAILDVTPALAAIGGALETVAMAIFGFIVWKHRGAQTHIASAVAG
jgi:hypothetical protein